MAEVVLDNWYPIVVNSRSAFFIAIFKEILFDLLRFPSDVFRGVFPCLRAGKDTLISGSLMLAEMAKRYFLSPAGYRHRAA